MAPTKYTFSVSTDFVGLTASTPDLPKFIDAVEGSSIATDLDHIGIAGDAVDVWFQDALSAGDETTLDGLVAAHDGEPRTVPASNFRVKVYSSGQLTSDAWYATDNGDGTYADKAEETVYTYQGSKVTRRVLTKYWGDGSTHSVETWDYYATGASRIEKKV